MTTTLLSGCQFLRSEPPDPDISIASARTYPVSSDQFVAAVRLEKRGDTEATATVRWELDVGEYTQAVVQEFVLRTDITELTVSLFTTVADDTPPEALQRSEVKLIRPDAADSGWFAAPVQTE
ncbi:hypothetical protein [Haladaptatus sp. DYF46]|uniref:hypothetical protein n=1 Tax=Haladaptatus sp. DYF46 TaxID=2886041 RepID=UPI001E2CB3F7|nr:hypothetical protein [Haladaptatus sp. DYF46]